MTRFVTVSGEQARCVVYQDPRGHTLTVWFDDPEKEDASEETGDEVVLIKDMDGRSSASSC